MTRHAKIMARRLNQIEDEFRLLLISCLKECAGGRWGLFGQNDEHIEARLLLSWPEADRLKGLAQEIKSAHEEAGTRNDLCDRFLALSSLRGPQVQSEPKLAAAFLAEITVH